MPDFTDDVFFASATELNRRLRAREFSATELTRAFCDRLERVAPRYNALALSLRDLAMRKAREVEDEIKRERFRGPLQGVPYGAKDLLNVAGQITTWGAKPYAAQVFDHDATVITRLAKTGAILTGKLSMIELAGPIYRYASASLFGPGLNPHDRTRWSGGSSSGSGSAVAAGIVTYALGSETSGSILIPSAFCGVTGLRPTYGLVSRYGAMPLSWTLDKIGPMCRTAVDCGHVLQAIAGKDDNDPSSAGKSFYYAPQYSRDIKTVRIGYAPSDFDQGVEPGTRAQFGQALEALKSLGVQLREVKLADKPYGALLAMIVLTESGSIFEELIESGGVDALADPLQIANMKASLDVPSRDYLRAMRLRREVQTEFRRVLMDVDLLLAPTHTDVASGVKEPLDRPPRSASPGIPPGLLSLTPASNLAGLPALALPAGFVNGLPVGIQLVGRAFSENLLLSVGTQFQQATNWHRQRPPMS